MEAELQTHVAFHLTGKRPAAELEAVDPTALVPALLARYRSLEGLRYDYPVVLASGPKAKYPVEPLSAIVDRVLKEIAQGDDGERLSHHAMRMEAMLRSLLAAGATGTLSSLWEAAARKLAVLGGEGLSGSLTKLRDALKTDGELVDCDANLAPRLAAHAAARVYEGKAARFRDEIERLIRRLTDILDADFARSARGRTADSLRAAVGSLYEDAFDFEAMSKVLTPAVGDATMPESRRSRIRALLDVLKSQRFFAVEGGTGQVYAFTFTSCREALAAYRERMHEVTELARTIAVAELEIVGEYRETRHDAFFANFVEEDLDPKDLALFPDYLVCITTERLDAVENGTLMEILSAGLPIKVLVETADILDESGVGDGHFGFGARTRQLAHMAMGLNEVYVMQCPASHLYQYRDRLVAGLQYAGPALFCCYCPAGSTASGLSPYMLAAAAMEARIFPAFVYDPAAGHDWATRFDLAGNPQVDLDWPTQPFEYEDANHQHVTEELAFTLVDFVACDGRYARHFAGVPAGKGTSALTPIGAALARPASATGLVVPCLWMVDRSDRLHKVIVDDKLMREAKRCREMWHSLQELGGVHNSHAERLLAREREALAAQAAEAAATAAIAEPAAAAAPAASAAEAPAEAAAEPAPDEAYIETPRCTSCNECTNLNPKMFGYNENKQAMIIDVNAGTYAQLVEAAENCQVSIIHPGKPRNPKEPGLAELVERAKPFL